MTRSALWIRRLAWLLFLLLPLVGGIRVWMLDGYSDFDVFYKASERLNSGAWSEIYTQTDGIGLFRYSPFMFPLFWPLTWLPHVVAREIWFIFQLVCLAGGMGFLSRISRTLYPGTKGSTILALAFLGSLRFIWDSILIGQVSGLMFFGLSAGLYGWTQNQATLSAAGLFIPTTLKIAPGLQYLLLLFQDIRFLRRMFVPTAALAIGSLLGVWILSGSLPQVTELLTTWWRVLTTVIETDSPTSRYLFYGHYGSQTLNSAFIRLLPRFGVDAEWAKILWIIFSVPIGVLTLWIWINGKFRTTEAKGLAYSLGILTHFLIIPFTFKYTLVFLMIPLFWMIPHWRSSRFLRGSLVFCALTLSLPGKDYVPDSLFFGMQEWSLPTLAILLLWISALKLTHEVSRT